MVWMCAIRLIIKKTRFTTCFYKRCIALRICNLFQNNPYFYMLELIYERGVFSMDNFMNTVEGNNLFAKLGTTQHPLYIAARDEYYNQLWQGLALEDEPQRQSTTKEEA